MLVVLSAACGPAQIITPTAAATPALAATLTPVSAPSETATALLGIQRFSAAELSFNDIQMLDAQHGWAWASAAEEPRVMLTSDGGESWTDRSPRESGDWSRLGNGFFLDAQRAWVASYDPGTGASLLLRTTDGGQSWVSINQALGQYSRFDFFTPLEGLVYYAPPEVGPVPGIVLRTDDGGLTWDRYVEVYFDEAPSHDSRLQVSRHGWAGLYADGRIILTASGPDIDSHLQRSFQISTSEDSGRTWTDRRFQLDDRVPGSVVDVGRPIYADKNHGFLWLGVRQSATKWQGELDLSGLYRTNDGGKSWTPGAFLPWLSGRGFQALSATEAISICGSHLCATRDAGSSWTVVKPDIDFGTAGTLSYLWRVDFTDLQTGWAVVYDDSGHHLYRTADGGYTWNLLSK